MEWNPDGTHLASSSLSEVCLWDAGSLQRRARFTSCLGVFVRFSADGQKLLFYGPNWEDGLQVWSVDDLEKGANRPLMGTGGVLTAVNDACFSPDGSLIVSLGGPRMQVIRVADGAVEDAHTGARGSMSVGHWFQAHLLLTAGNDMKAHIRRILPRTPDGKGTLIEAEPFITFNGHEGRIQSARASEDAAAVLTSGGDTARIWDIRVPEAPILPQDDARSVAFSEEGDLMLTTSWFRLGLWSRDGRLLTEYSHAEADPEICCAAFAPSGRYIVVLNQGPVGWLLRRFEVERRGPDEVALAVREELGADGAKVSAWTEFVDEDRVLATAGDEIVLWHPVTGRVDRYAAGDHVNHVAVDPSRERFAACTKAGTVLLWGFGNPEPEHVFRFGAGVSSASFSPDGRMLLVTPRSDEADDAELVAIDARNEALLIEIETGETVRAYGPHDGEVLSGRFSPDGRRVLTASRDGKARLWNVDGRLEAVLDPRSGITWQAVFSPDGSRILTSSFASARVWITEPEELLRVARSRLTGLKSMLSDAEWQTYVDLIE